MKLIIVGISLLIAFLNIFITHMIKTKFPKAYFSLGEIIITENDDISIFGIITKFCPPFMTGLVIGLLPIVYNMEITLLFSFFASFLVVWPVILSGNSLLSWEMKKRIKTLYLLYVFYIVTYILFALFGNFLGKRITGIDLNIEPILGKINGIYNSWNPFIQNIFGGVIGSAIFASISTILISIYKFLLKKLKKSV
ncbi:MAG: hypothetical protein LBC76_03990 [Treponema sp.]|jgi:hypothetical protein|nr:hypothetical protein [Treponema sp.]